MFSLKPSLWQNEWGARCKHKGANGIWLRTLAGRHFQVTLELKQDSADLSDWYNRAIGNLVSNQSYNTTNGCITVSVTETSSPSIRQLTGTIFGVASGLSVAQISISPLYAVQRGSEVKLTASISDANWAVGVYTAQIVGTTDCLLTFLT